MRRVRVLSLFDGMACGMLAMQGAGVDVERYVAFEIDKYAVQTSAHNFPMIEHRGDVFKADFSEFDGFDFLVGGSPCTHWSIARTDGRRETEASGVGWELFSQYVRALHEAQPKWFIYENNKSMSSAIRESITSAFGFEPICINSALVSAQNRQRLYWVGRRNADGTYSKVAVEQPEDRGVLLKHILDDGCFVDKEKAYCLKHQAGNARDYFKKHHTQIKFEPVNTTTDGKAQCLRSTCYKDGIRNMVGNTIDRKTCVAEPVGIGYRGRMNDGKWVKQYESNGTEKANAITTAQTDSMVAEPVSVRCRGRDGVGGKWEARSDGKNGVVTANTVGVNIAVPVRVGTRPRPNGVLAYATPCEWGKNGKPVKAIAAADGKAYPVYEVKDGQITIKGKQYPIKLLDGFYIIRKLTVSECKRLQTVPEWYEFPVSDTQAYKMLGNGWTVDVIVHLIKSCNAMETEA